MKMLANAMRLQAMRAGGGRVTSRIGVVTSYNPADFAVKVKLQPDDVHTGWLPIAAPWIGNGWGMFAAPNVGDMVLVVFIDGDLEAGVCEARLWNDTDRPLAPPAGEFWLVHSTGAFFKLLNNGHATFDDGHGARVTLNGDGTITSAATTWNHTGDVNVTGTVTATTDVFGGGKSLKTHTHTGVTAGASNTGPPA